MSNSSWSFAISSRYWGARALFPPGRYWYDDVISKGLEQRRYSPKYTTSARYTIGSSVIRNGRTVVTPAIYRCDTFVIAQFGRAMLYAHPGNGPDLHDLVLRPSVVTPASLFDIFHYHL